MNMEQLDAIVNGVGGVEWVTLSAGRLDNE